MIKALRDGFVRGEAQIGRDRGEMTEKGWTGKGYSYLGQGFSSVAEMPAWQVQGPKFNPRSSPPPHRQKKKKDKGYSFFIYLESSW